MPFRSDLRPIFMLVASSVCMTAAIGQAQQIQVNKNNRTLAITASDSAEMKADVAQVHVGYVVYGPDANAAYAQASKASNAIARTLAEAGVGREDIQSEAQSVSETPQFQLEKLPPAEQAQRRYQAQQSWTVKTKADDAARVLNAAVHAGANNSGQIDWSVSDENTLEAKAAGKALARAKEIAAQMAAGLSIKLGDLIYASNQVPEGPRPIMMRAMAAPAAAPAETGAPLAISPNKVSRSATVYAVFSIE